MLDLYLKLQGRAADLESAIHPSDQMYRFIGDLIGPHATTEYQRLHYFMGGYEILLSLENAVAAAGRDSTNQISTCARCIVLVANRKK